MLGALLIAPTTTEFASKVALLSSLAIVCVALPVLRALPRPLVRRRVALVLPFGLALYAGALVLLTSSMPASPTATGIVARDLPPIRIDTSSGVQSQLDRVTARAIATALVKSVPAAGAGEIRLHLVPGTDQGPPLAVALVGGTTYRLHQVAVNGWALGSDTQPQQQVQAPPSGPVAKGFRLQNVASSVGHRLPPGLVPVRDDERTGRR